MNNENYYDTFTRHDHINVSEYYEAEYWSKKFGVSIEQLKSAIKAVGNSVHAVEMRIKRRLT